jgi:hypothetical protein
MILVWDRNGQRHVTGLLRRVSAASVHPFPEPKPKKEKEPEKEPEPKKDEDKKPDAPAAGAGAEDPKKDEGKEKEKKEDETPPKAPRKDLALEPYRPLLTADIPLFIGLGNPRLARDLLEVARNGYEVTTVVTSAERYADLWERMAELGVGYSPTGSPVEEDGAERRVLALEAIRRRIPVALRSGPDGDARTLYAAASHAVRCGVPSTQGLQMITRWSALVLGLQDRIGSLAEGMDADLVLLTGTPFAPGSRVERVMIDGRFLDEPVREVR